MLSPHGKRFLWTSSRCMLRHSSPLLRRWSRTPATKITIQSATTSSPQSFSTASSSLSNDTTDSDKGNICHHDEIQQANLDYANRLVVRETDDEDGSGAMGWGVYAATDYEAESLVLTGHTRQDPAAKTTTISSSSSIISAHSIQTGRDEHVIMDLPARFLNHACGSGANVGVRSPAVSSRNIANSSIRREEGQTVGDPGTPVYDFVAKRDIAAGEQLFFDYETTEYQLQSPFDCACGSPDCRGRLQGFGVHKARVLRDHGREWIAPYLLKTLDRS